MMVGEEMYSFYFSYVNKNWVGMVLVVVAAIGIRFMIKIIESMAIHS